MPQPSVVRDGTSWAFQQSYVERLMDHAALTSAHPDDTLIMAGPARYGADPTSFVDQLLPIGMVQTMNVSNAKPFQPATAIGSGRMFFLAGKAPGNANISRLFVNGRNLLRVLYTNLVRAFNADATIDPRLFDDIAAAQGGGSNLPQFFANLDSELFLIPFGLACFFRDKLHQAIGSFYLELCQITMHNIGYTAGQSMILENVTILFDRLWPIGMLNVPGHQALPTGLDVSSLLTKILGPEAGVQAANDEADLFTR